MTKLFLLVLSVLVLASISSANAAGLAKHHHGKKSVIKHHHVHHAKAHRHMQA